MAVAELGIKITSTGANTAAADLDKVAQSAGRAEQATAKVTSNIIPFRHAVDAVGASSRNTAFMMRNLSFQVNDIASGLASGQSPFTILAQQGGQVYQALQMGPGGVGGSLRAIGEQISALITPTRLALAGLAGIAAAGAAAAISWKNYAVEVSNLSRITGVATDDLSKMQTAASFKGIGQNEFAEGMKGLSKATYEAKLGLGDLGKLLLANNMTVGTTRENYAQVADLIARARGDTEKQFAILRMAGMPATIEWVNALEPGAAAIERATGAIGVFGQSMDETARKAKEFDNLWNEATTNAARYFRAWGADVAKEIGDIVGSSGFRTLYAFLTMTPGEALGKIRESLRSEGERLAGLNKPTPEAFGLTMPREPFGPPMSMMGGRTTIDPRSIKDDAEKATRAQRELRQQLTDNDRLFRKLTDSAEGFASSLIEGFAQGGNMADTLSRALQGLSSDLIRLGSKQVIGGLTQALTGGAAGFSGYNTTGGIVGGNATGGGNLLGSIGGALGLTGPVGALIGGLGAIGGGFISNLFGGNQQKKQQQQQQQMQAALQKQQEEQQRIIRAEESAMDFRFQAAQMRINTSTQAGAMVALENEIARGRAEAAKTGGSAIIAYEELAQAERLQLEKEWAEKIESLRRDYLDREFAALNDTTTLSGKLAEYERKAAREREDAVKAGGLALIELDRAQAAERGRILKDTAKEITDYYGGLRDTISDFTRGLQFGAASTLSPAEQFLAARNDFQNQLIAAQGGNRAAQGSITQVAQTLIEQARSYLGPSIEFGNLVSRVTEQLNTLPDIAMVNDPQVQELQRLGGDYFAPMVERLSQIADSQDTVSSLLDIIARLIANGNLSSEQVSQAIDRLRNDIRTSNSAAQLRAAV